MLGLSTLLDPGTWRFTASVARARNDYATHLPVLLGLAKWTPIRSVLELGSGIYSTPTFLNRNTFPELETLDSFETDNEWARKISGIVTADPRASLHVVKGAMAAAVDQLQLDNYDLIFVDDSTDARDRVRTIAALQKQNPRKAVVVIHDFELPQYRSAARRFPHRHSFRAFNPETGIVWQNELVRSDALMKIDAVMKRHAHRLEPDDTNGWLQAFAELNAFQSA
jgi:predicted O-methyltransferase YrrM